MYPGIKLRYTLSKNWNENEVESKKISYKFKERRIVSNWHKNSNNQVI